MIKGDEKADAMKNLLNGGTAGDICRGFRCFNDLKHAILQLADIEVVVVELHHEVAGWQRAFARCIQSWSDPACRPLHLLHSSNKKGEKNKPLKDKCEFTPIGTKCWVLNETNTESGPKARTSKSGQQTKTKYSLYYS